MHVLFYICIYIYMYVYSVEWLSWIFRTAHFPKKWIVLSSERIYHIICFFSHRKWSSLFHVTSVTSCDSRRDGHQGAVWMSSEAGSMLGWNQWMTLDSPSPKVAKLGSLISEPFPASRDGFDLWYASRSGRVCDWVYRITVRVATSLELGWTWKFSGHQDNFSKLNDFIESAFLAENHA